MASSSDSPAPRRRQEVTPTSPSPALPTEREARWRLILGLEPGPPSALEDSLTGLYGAARTAPLPSERVTQRLRFAEALQTQLPDEAVQVAREDALDAAGLRALLREPRRVTPSQLAHLPPSPSVIARVLAVSERLPPSSREALRRKVAELAARLTPQFEAHFRTALQPGPGAGSRRAGPRLDLRRTLRANLKHVVPGTGLRGLERLVFHPSAAALPPLRLLLVLDRSGSMGEAQLHAVLAASVLARLPGVEPRLLLFDTRVVDASGLLGDPVALLLETSPGGGTAPERALAAASRLVERAERTLLVLISDFEPGAAPGKLRTSLDRLSAQGIRLLCLQVEGEPGAATAIARNVHDLQQAGVAVHPCDAARLVEQLGAALHGLRFSVSGR